MSELSERIASLSQEKRELLEKLLKKGGVSRARPAVIPRAARANALPLSFAQQRLWFLDQLEPGNSFYNISSHIRFSSAVNVSALRASLNEIIRRHEILRSSFKLVDDRPVQVVASSLNLPLPLSDLSQLAPHEREREASRLASLEAQQPFDLARGPLLRARLVRLNTEQHILLLTMHHIVSDTWSLGVLERELWTLYDPFLKGQPSPLEELPIQYGDYAAWQREHLQGEILEAQLAYWKRQLQSAPSLLELPTDRPRPPVQSYRGASQWLSISPELTERLKRLSQRENVTLFMTLLAAFQVLLARHAGQSDILVGTPVAGRNRMELEGLIGFFINTLVLRTNLAGEPTFRETLARVREVCVGAYAHQDVPFEKLVEELQPERSLSRNPLFQVTFQLFSDAPSSIAAPSADVAAETTTTSDDESAELGAAVALEDAQPEGELFLDIERGTAIFDLTFDMWENDGRLSGRVEYSTDLFDAATIERLLVAFEQLLEGAAINPDARISRLPLLSETERAVLLDEWNDTRAEHSQDVCLHQLFEQQVERTPSAVAVVFEQEQLTYAQLNRRANQLARYLRRLGVGPERLVGVLMERSVELVVALLGVLKAGAAYVPLDPSYPQERLRFMLEDAGASVLLAQRRVASLLPKYDGRIVLVDDEREAIEGLSAEPLRSGVTAQNLAYVLFTSGSTGAPKGVMISHRAICNHMLWMKSQWPLDGSDAVLQKTPVSFDASVWEFYAPLMMGARLVLARPEGQRDSAYLVEAIKRFGVTVVQLVPLQLQMLLDEPELSECRSLRRVFCGGEALPNAFSQRLNARLDVELYNIYGPTEATIDATAWRCEPGAERAAAPIGRPISNTQIHLLDQHLQPVPIGVAGELYVAGAGLARGYLNRPDLTAEKFIPNPFSHKPGERLYKTGDLARYLADGAIEFIGRLDHQVKLRGFRIELGEIEALLRQHDFVREAAVLVREDTPGDRRLVAYVVPADEPDGPVVEPELAPLLRAHLKSHLPEHMLPSAFVWLDALPLTAGGKLDWRALPAADDARPVLDEMYSTPRTPVEEILANIWAAILRLERVGVNDNFFELGGHSLLGTQVISRVREAFHVELPLRTIFETPTIAGMAETVEHALRAEGGSLAPPLVPIRRDRELPLSFAQQRLWFLDQLVPGNPFYNVDTTTRLNLPLDVAALEQSLNEIVRRHEALRTTFQMVDGQPAQVVGLALHVSLPVVDLAHLPLEEREREAARLAQREAQLPFNLAAGPLLRASLLRLAPDEHLLLLTLHHIVTDGWSMGLLFEELWTLYDAYSTGRESELVELPLQYADFAVWQREWLQGEVLERQLSYWKRQLADIPALQLPTDHVRPAVSTYRGARMPLRFPAELTAQLKKLSRREGATLYMTLLAAFKALLCRYSGQTDIVVGTPVAGRDRIELERLIGFFVNTLALRTDVSGDPEFKLLLERVREVCLAAYAHQEAPFERLVEELQPERDLSRNPLFQVTFQLFSALDLSEQAAETTEQTLQVERGTAIFDLAFTLWESPDGLGGQVEYSTELFDAATIERMIERYERLLEGVVSDPSLRLSELPLLGADEREQLLVLWNQTQSAVHQEQRCVHQLFEQQAEREPLATALVNARGEAVSYGELNRRANQLAHRLAALGIGPEARVGVLLERSVELCVALLGVLKTGAAYVPLDNSYPRERLAFMLKDAGVAALLTEQRFVNALASYDGPLLCLDTEQERLAQERQENLAIDVRPENLAYVIYTSGSTGKPKGVGIEHRSFANLVNWHAEAYGLTSEDCAALLSAPAFDASVWELWPYLCAGASVHIPSDEVRESPPLLLDWLASQRISICFMPTPLAEIIIEETLPASLSLRTLLTGADKLHVWPKASLPFRLANNYGPTENTVVTTSAWIEAEAKRDALPPIGRPVDNVQVYILDKNLQPVPVGVAGELCAGGRGLARGYLNQPELTAEKFIPHPFSAEPGARLYRTGDLARYQADGQIEFLGRTDEQVKVRGYRIELGEIEAVLAQHELVREAVVVAREDEIAGRRLVAYVVPKIESSLSSEQTAELQSQQVSQWQLLYDDTYRQEQERAEPSFNIVGWNSSYTNAPIPAAEMREWRNATVERILSLRPRRALEIGCGTGLLLSQVATHCEAYYGTDFSQSSLDYVQQHLLANNPALSHVQLLKRRADEFAGLEAEQFDLVILNSVAQYFPSLDYFLRVLEGALKILRPGGCLFLGDLRNLKLLEAFHASVQLYQAQPALDALALRERVRQSAALEEELLIDPALFDALGQRFPQLASVGVQLKRSVHHNELTRFRYDVALRLGSRPAAVVESPVLDWQQLGLTVDALKQMLVEQQPEQLEFRRVPNARVAADVLAVELLSSHEDVAQTAFELREALAAADVSVVDPEDVWRLSESLPYSVNIRWSATDDSCFDVLLRRRLEGSPDFSDDTSSGFAAAAPRVSLPLARYANNPLRGMLSRSLVPQLRSFVRERLPEHMMPATFMMLDALPLTAHGKLDKRALPTPDHAAQTLRIDNTGPRNKTEEALAAIWTEVLGLERVGVLADFFELGGHSLLATKIVSRIRSAFQIELPLRSLFETPTIANLAAAVTKAQSNGGGQSAPAIKRVSREQYRLKINAEPPPFAQLEAKE
jgi:amino acid adenylation domain-containing protein